MHRSQTGGFENVYKLMFARSTPNNVNLHEIKILCQEMNDQSMCLRCGPGYYRDSLNSTNGCLNTTEFPAGYGVNEAANLMSPCNELCDL